jgi:hypothetical protein
LATLSYWLLWRYVTTARYVREEALSAVSNLHFDRYAGLSALGYILVIPAAHLSPPLALALVFLTTTFARTISHRVLTATATLPGGSVSGVASQNADPVDTE